MLCSGRLGVCAALVSGFGMLCVLPAGARDNTGAAGDGLFVQGKFNQARDAYVAALRGEPKNVALHLNLIRTLLRLDNDRWREAIAEGRVVTGIAPQNAEAHGLYSLALMRGGRPDSAAAEAQKALKLNPKSYYGLVAAGRVATWNEHDEEAQTELRQAVAIRPDQPDAYYYLIDSLDSKQYDEIKRLAAAYVKLHPKGHPHDRAIDGMENTVLGKDTEQKLAAAKPEHDDGLIASKGIDPAKLPTRTMTFSIERKGDDIILPVTINGTSFRLLFDTGAGHGIAVSEAGVDHLQLPVLGQSIARGVSGKEVTRLYRAESLRVGRANFKNVTLHSTHGGAFSGTDGLIGGAIFDDCAVTVDFKANTMTLARGKDAAAPPPAEGNHIMTVPFHNRDGYIIVPIRLADRTQTEWALLDTGAEPIGVLSLITSRELAKKVVTGTDGDLTSVEVTVNQRLGVGDSAPSFTALVFRFAVDLALCHNSGTPYFMEMNPIFGTSMIDTEVNRGFDFHLSAIVGIKYLTNATRVTFDYPHHLLTMEFTGS